jgi:hypothetical protein
MRQSNKLPPGLQLPIKIAIFKEIVKNQNPEVAVKLTIAKQQPYWRNERQDEAKAGRFVLMRCNFFPDGWFLNDNPTIQGRIFGIPTTTWEQSGNTREHFLRLFERHIKSVSAKNVWNAQWELNIIWDSSNSRIEYGSVIGIKTKDEESTKESVATVN